MQVTNKRNDKWENNEEANGDKEEGGEEKEKGDKVIPEDMEEEKRRLEMRRECFEVEEQKVERKR